MRSDAIDIAIAVATIAGQYGLSAYELELILDAVTKSELGCKEFLRLAGMMSRSLSGPVEMNFLDGKVTVVQYRLTGTSLEQIVERGRT